MLKKKSIGIGVLWWITRILGTTCFLLFFSPAYSTYAFSFPLEEGTFNDGNQKTISSESIEISGSVPLSGSFEVQASFAMTSGGEVDTVLVYGESGVVTLTNGGAPVTIFNNYNFTTSGGIFSLDVEPTSDKYGTGIITFTIVGTPDGDLSGELQIDTRLMGEENFGSHRYAEDPWGNLIDLNQVTVTDTRITGLIWSECCGWIDLQAPNAGDGISITIVSDQEADLSGNAWNPNFGWIAFGPVEGQGGVYIDNKGYFHGTAYSENFGNLSFGNYMEINPGAVIQPTETLLSQKTVSWAQTTWRIPVNHAPTVTLVDPEDDPDGLSPLATRTPTLSFRPNDEDADLGKTKGILIRYTLYLERKAPNGSWSSAPGSPFQHEIADINVGSTYDHIFTDDLPAGDYRWSVQVTDDLGLSSAITDPWHFTIVNDAPLSALIYPIGGETVTPGLQTIDGEEYTVDGRKPPFIFTITESDSNSIRYTVEISNDNFATLLPQSSNFSAYIVQTEPTTKYVYTPPSDLPAGTLSWRVVIEDSEGLQSISDIETFVIQNAKPTIDFFQMLDNNDFVIPNGGETFDTTPTFSWRAEDPDGSQVTVTATVVGQQQEVITHHNGYYEFDINALPEGTYTYNVQICDSDGDCLTSSDKTITITTPDRLGNIGTSNIALMTPERLFAPDVVSTNNRYAWNDSVGWIDMNPLSGGVIVFNDDLRGFAWNDTLGWIRFNCNLDNTGFTGMSNECDTNDYGVFNDLGQLTGKALIESSGQYIYFDEQSYLDDFGGDPGDYPDIDADISCDADAQGHFLGRAWSPDIGWIEYGWEEILARGGTETNAKDVFSITEWSCVTEGPQPIEKNKFYVFAATEDDVSYPLAEKSGVSGGGDLACVNGVGGTDISVHRMIPHPIDGADIGSDLNDISGETWDYELDVTDFSIGCENPDGNTDGKLWITISDGSHQVNRTPGIYRISGVVGDSNDNNLAFPVDDNADNTHHFENEWIFQVVSGTPDLTHGNTLTVAKYDNNGTLADNFSLVADGQDTTRVIVTPYDSYGNSVINEYQYQDSSKTLIKEVALRSVFRDSVKIDQVEPLTSPLREAVTFSTPQQEVGAPAFDGDSGKRAVFYLQNTDAITPTLTTEFSSIAPTGGSNTLELNRLEISVRQVLPSTEPLSIGQTLNDDGTPDWITETLSNQTYPYRPILESSVLNFNEFATLENVESELLLQFDNNSNSVDLNTFDWAGILRTKLAGLPAGTIFRNTYLALPPLENPTETLRNDSYQEVSRYPSSYIRGITSLFQKKLEEKLGERVTEIIGQKLNYTIIDSRFPSISRGNTLTFSMKATPDTTEALEGEQTEFLQYFSWKVGEKVVKYPLLNSQRLTSPGGLKVSVSGSVHGEQIDEEDIVGETSAFSEFSIVGQIYDRRDIRQILYENYREITGNLTPVTNSGTASTQIEVIKDWEDLNALRNRNDNRSLQNGKVVWFMNNDTKDANSHLSVILGKPIATVSPDGTNATWDPLTEFDVGDSFYLPPPSTGEEPYTITLIVYGGNLYIRNNIYTSPNSNLGIIVLSSKEARTDCYTTPKGDRCGTEGNIFINPEVTHIEGVLYADGSVMSSNDTDNDGISEATDNDNIIQEDEIIDGFSSELERIDFENQLYIRGSLASQNITGTLGMQNETVELSPESWLPRDCGDPPSLEGCGSITDQKKAAQRFDLSYLRQYRLFNVFTDADDDGITNDYDCDFIADPEENGCICTDDQCYNPTCETAYQTPISPLPSACEPLFIGKTTNSDGRCAAGTRWCPVGITGEPYTIDCSDNSTDLGGGITPQNLCSVGGDDVANQKTGAAIVIEYDPKVKKLTPVGMNLPPVVNFEKQ